MVKCYVCGKDKCHDSTYMMNLKNKINKPKQKKNFLDTENRFMVARERGNWGKR